MDPKTLKLLLEDVLTKALANHPTKDDLKKALSEQSDDICKTMHDLFTVVDKKKADKKEVHALDKRVSILEQN